MQVGTFDLFSGQPFPKADIITMALILHNWGKDKKRLLLREVRMCLCQKILVTSWRFA